MKVKVLKRHKSFLNEPFFPVLRKQAENRLQSDGETIQYFLKKFVSDVGGKIWFSSRMRF